jgi:hypothetical protein
MLVGVSLARPTCPQLRSATSRLLPALTSRIRDPVSPCRSPLNAIRRVLSPS